MTVDAENVSGLNAKDACGDSQQQPVGPEPALQKLCNKQLLLDARVGVRPSNERHAHLSHRNGPLDAGPAIDAVQQDKSTSVISAWMIGDEIEGPESAALFFPPPVLDGWVGG